MAMLKRLLMVLVAVLLIAVPASLAQGAPGGGGPPDGKGGGPPADSPRPDVGGGRPDGAGTKKGDIFADLWVIARYTDGTPITIDYTVEGETGEEVYRCIQPITFDSASGFPAFTDDDLYPYAGTPYRIPLAGDSMQAAVAAEAEDETELAPCDVAVDALAYLDEVDMGRLNLGRAPERVLAKQLRDVVSLLGSGPVTLDASGRFVVNADTELEATLDSPLGNLAAMQAILETGLVGGVGLPSVDLGAWELTAAQFAAGAPKEDFTITVDTVQYLNRILSIPTDTTWAPTLPGETGETFLDFAGFSYTRSDVFKGCVKFSDPLDGYVEKTLPLEDVVPFDGSAAQERFGIDGYAHFAEDARDVLVWIHYLGLLVQDFDPITMDDLCTS